MTATGQISPPVSGRIAGMSYGTYATVLLALVNAANYMDRSILSILAQPIKNELKLSDSQLGLLLGPAFVLLFALVAVPLGRLADRAGRRWVLAASAMVWSFFSTASGFAHSLAQLAIARVGIGVGESGGMPSSHALISAFYPPNRRAVPFSIFTAGATFGIALGLGFGGFIASRYGWRAAFVATGVPGFVLAVLVAATLPEPHSVARQSVPLARVRFWVALQGLSRIRTYRWIVCSHPCYTFITTGVLAWFPSFYIRTHGMGLQYVGTFFGIVVGVGVSGANILGAVVAQRLDRRAPQRGLTFSAWTTLLGFPFYITALLAPTGTLSLVLSTCFFMLMGAAGAPIISGQQGVIGADNRALGSAISLFVASYLGAGLGPWLIGAGSQALMPILGVNSLRAALQVASLGILACAFFLMMAARNYAAEVKSDASPGVAA